jgi:hypothetical protein
LHVEIVAFRYQLAVYQRSVQGPHLRPADRIEMGFANGGWILYASAAGSFSSQDSRMGGPTAPRHRLTRGVTRAELPYPQAVSAANE